MENWDSLSGSRLGTIEKKGRGIMGRLRLRVKEVAKEKNFKMMDLVRDARLALNTVRSIYHDPYRTVNTDTIMRLANALGVNALDLIEEVSDDVARAEIEAIKKGLSIDET